ncbi:TatD family hydrolase [Polaribacter sp.]|uniref:TatD family hydrolase n=1 Tax=Polaribacter sp. TaxID=1920175 RepID=UPI003F695486
MDFIDIHTHKKQLSENVFSVANKYPVSLDFTSPFSIGIHPWFINKNKIEAELLILAKKLQHKNCVALGECGLDKVIKTDFELQKTVFKKQIQLSEKYQKPLIIHCVKAYQDIVELKKELKPTQVWLVHGFNKNWQVAQSLLKNGILLSFGTAMINHKKLQEVVAKVPLEKLFLETDDKDDAIVEVYVKLAKLKGVPLEILQQKIQENFKQLFLKTT